MKKPNAMTPDGIFQRFRSNELKLIPTSAYDKLNEIRKNYIFHNGKKYYLMCERDIYKKFKYLEEHEIIRLEKYEESYYVGRTHGITICVKKLRGSSLTHLLTSEYTDIGYKEDLLGTTYEKNRLDRIIKGIKKETESIGYLSNPIFHLAQFDMAKWCETESCINDKFLGKIYNDKEKAEIKSTQESIDMCIEQIRCLVKQRDEIIYRKREEMKEGAYDHILKSLP